MFKKSFFSALLMFGQFGGILSAQEIAFPFHPPMVQEKTVQEPETIFIPFNQSLPAEVLKTKNESMVIIRVNTPKVDFSGDQKVSKDYVFGGGVAVWPGYVLTCLHLMGEYPALWEQTSQDFPMAIEISDGHAVFTASLVEYNYKMDLALLKVDSPNEDNKVFQPKPARLAKSTTIQDPDLVFPKVWHEKFYVFYYFASDPHLFYTRELGPYLAITNNFDSGYLLEFPVGMLQGRVQGGFSGGPLISSDGLVMGMVDRGSEFYTYVVLIETINRFLESAHIKLGLDQK